MKTTDDKLQLPYPPSGLKWAIFLDETAEKITLSLSDDKGWSVYKSTRNCSGHPRTIAAAFVEDAKALLDRVDMAAHIADFLDVRPHPTVQKIEDYAGPLE